MDQAAKLRELAQVTQLKEDVYTQKISVTKDEGVNADGRIIAVTGGKGGVGKTNCVINLALLLAKFNKRVVIVDLDLGLANIDILLNVSAKYNIEDVIKGRKQIGEILLDGPRHIKILPGGSGITSLADLNDDERGNFIQGFTKLKEDFDFILLDTAAGISKNVIEFVLIADDVIIVTTPEPTAITDAYAAIKVIGARNKDINVFVLFNMVESAHEAEVYFNKVNQVIRQFLNIQVQLLGYVLHDVCVKKAIMRRKPFLLLFPFCPATRSMHLVARNFIKYFSGKNNSKRPLMQFVKNLFTNKEQLA